jgi:hypothetical protein
MEQLEWRAAWLSDEDWEQGQQAVIQLEVDLMEGECTQAIVDAIDRLGRAMDACCVMGQGIPYFEDVPDPLERGSGDPPEGFETWDDHTDYLCKAAQVLFDRLAKAVLDLQDKVESGVTLTTAILFAVLALTNPVLGLIITLSTLLVEIAALEGLGDLVDAFIEAKWDFVCAIFSASSVEGALANLATVISSLDVSLMGKKAIGTLFTTNALNAIFLGTYELPGGYSEEYCDECPGICPLITIRYGQQVGYLQYEALPYYGWYYCELMFRMPTDWAPCGDPLAITVGVISGSVSGDPAEKRWRLLDGEGNMLYQQNDPPEWPFCCQAIWIKSITPFTVQLDHEECE